MVESYGIGLDRIGDARPGQQGGFGSILPRLRKPTPQVHIGADHVVDASRPLVEVRRLPYYAREIVAQAWQIRCWEIRRRQILANRRIDALLGSLHVAPRDVPVR